MARGRIKQRPYGRNGRALLAAPRMAATAVLFLQAVLGQELVDPPGTVQHLLLAGVERVAVAADFGGQLLAAGGLGLVDMAARAASDSCLVVVGWIPDFMCASFYAVGTPSGGPVKSANLGSLTPQYTP